jgi:acetyltransferase-like isoleucine patch superfamily enzyme
LDRCLFWFLMTYSEEMPFRWKKYFAMYFPDARVRKRYWGHLGVIMGDETFPNPGFTVVKNASDTSSIFIGKRVSIAPNVIVITDSSPNNSRMMRELDYVKEHLVTENKVIIEDDAWIGAGAIIFPGVTVGRGAVVGAGSIVRDDVRQFTIVAGAPARFVRELKRE